MRNSGLSLVDRGDGGHQLPRGVRGAGPLVEIARLEAAERLELFLDVGRQVAQEPLVPRGGLLGAGELLVLPIVELLQELGRSGAAQRSPGPCSTRTRPPLACSMSAPRK